jgi:hypothetical protein
VLGGDDPTRRVVEAERLFDFGRDLDADSIAGGRRMGDRQQHDMTRPHEAVGRRDDAGRAVLA